MAYASLLELVRYGTATLEQMALNGEIHGHNLWVAVKGAEKYRRAVVKGDLAAVDEAERRRNICHTCPSRTIRNICVNGQSVTVSYCGPALEERLGDDFENPTCGCIVGLTIDNVVHTGGKTIVDSEDCPQGKWNDRT